MIEWIANPPGASVLSWIGRIDNPYGGGNMFSCSGTAVAIADLNFQTYLLPAGDDDDDDGDDDDGDDDDGDGEDGDDEDSNDSDDDD